MKGGVLVGLAALERLVGRRRVVELHCVPDEEGRNVAPVHARLDARRGRRAVPRMRARVGRDRDLAQGRLLGHVTAHGVPAHAGTSPDEGRSALRALARELLRIEGELHTHGPA